MIKVFMIKAFVFSGAALLSQLAFSLECKEAKWSEVKEWQKGKGPTELVFFASWCSSCKDSITKSYSTPVVFISVFDEKSDSERVLSHFVQNATCYFSKDIEKNFGIKALPKSLKYDF